MPRFFFDTSDGIRFVRDPDGLDLCSPADAHAEAIAAMPDLMWDTVREGNGGTCSATCATSTGA